MSVTQALLLPPDHMHRNGDRRVAWSRGATVVVGQTYRMGQWSLTTRSRVQSPNLRVHVAWLLDLFEPRSQALAALIDTGVRGDIFCYARGATPRPPALPTALRARADALGLPIVVDYYGKDDA
jgi:hypothetical protein